MANTSARAWPAAAARGPSSRKRSPFSRLSFGHAVMITAGLLAFLLNVLILRDAGDAVEVALAARSIPAGTRLESTDVAYRSVDAEGAFVDRALSREHVAGLVGQVVVRDVAAGAPLMAGDLRPVSGAGGQHAMSIPISSDHAVGAALHVGDRIDVMLVEGTQSRFVATGIEVLAVGRDARRLSESGFGLTVAVTRSQALMIASALNSGTVHLLRSTGLAVDRGNPVVRPTALPGLARQS